MSQVEVTIDSVRHGAPWDQWTVILRMKATEKSPLKEQELPIWVSPSQAYILAGELQGRLDKSTAPRQLLTNINAAESDIRGVTIHLDNNTFYAKLLLTGEVKCPIGIALALAHRIGAPILVDESTWEKAALTVNRDWPWGVADAVLRMAEMT